MPHNNYIFADLRCQVQSMVRYSYVTLKKTNNQMSKLLTAILIVSHSAVAGAAPNDSIVIGESLPMSGDYFPIANRIEQGAKAYIEYINSIGGLNGKKVELVTLDDGNDPQRYVKNVHRLVFEYNAVAILNCSSDEICQAAAADGERGKVPLVGNFSGLRVLRTLQNRQIFAIRASYDKEANALVRQLRAMGISSMAILTDKNPHSEQIEDIALAAKKSGLILSINQLTAINSNQIASTLADLKARGAQAIILELTMSALNAMGELNQKQRDNAPETFAALSSMNVAQLNKTVRGKTIVFTNVVPSPELGTLPLITEIQKNEEAFASADVLTFDGVESYINTKILIEAIRRAGPKLSSERIIAGLEAMSGADLGGFVVSFSSEHDGVSQWVDTGVNSRKGILLR